MDAVVWIVIALVIAAMVVALAWFGPRPGQWKTHNGRSTDASEPFETLPDDDED